MQNALVVAVVGFLLALGRPVVAQHLTPQEKVDSTFSANFHLIEERIKQQQPSSGSENRFAYAVDLLSGQDFFPITDWSGIPQLTEEGLIAAKKWYRATKGRIEWTKLRRGLSLLAVPLTDMNAADLEALKIK